MKNLIKIEIQTIGEDEVNAVDARGLQSFLENGQDFSNWISKRVEEYDFIEGSDFSIHLSKTPTGGRPRKEYTISIDMAKELSIIEHNAKGKEARKYFIAMEKKAKSIKALPDFSDPSAAWADEHDKSREYASVKRMQMLYHGQRFDWRALKGAIMDMGMFTDTELKIRIFDANCGNVWAYHKSVWLEAYSVDIDI